jgi:hypothetical protein
MKLLGRDEPLTLAEVQASADKLRATFDSLSGDGEKLKRKLEGDHYWLVETMWKIRKDVGVVKRENTSPRTSVALANKIIGLTLDLEYLEDRATEFAELLPDLVSPSVASDFAELIALISSAESSLRLYDIALYMAMMGIDVEGVDRLSITGMRPEIQDYLERFEKVEAVPKSMRMSVNLTKLRIHYEAALKQIDRLLAEEDRRVKKAVEKATKEAADDAKLYRFCDAQSAVAASCRKAKDWLEFTTDEHFEECCKALASEVRRAMSELGAATIDLQHSPNYGKYRSEYDAASLTSKSVLASIDKAVEHHQNSLTWWGRFANWVDNCLRTKEPM